MAGFIPAIHASVTSRNEDVDGRDKPGHDGETSWRAERSKAIQKATT
jgi:hypothetical protein